MKALFTVILFLFSYQNILAQIGLNQYPSNIKWKKIETPHFEIIFPADLVISGQRTANLLEYIYKPISNSLDVEIKHTPVILSNRCITSRGYARLAPRLTEWGSTPPQISSIGEWYDDLAVHEIRHIAQFDKTNKGFTKIMRFVFGDIGHLAFSGWTIPLWYWEGDAVGMETALTKGGRGRSSEFDMGFRTNLLSNKHPSYYKAYFRSYKDWQPNHYHLGYLLTTYAREKYGDDLWNKVLNRSARYSFWPFIMSSSLKKNTGQNLVGIYNATMNELKSRWQQQISNLILHRFF